jgi:hypothetical protein
VNTSVASRRRPSALMSVGLLALTAALVAALIVVFGPAHASRAARATSTSPGTGSDADEVARLRDEMKQMRRQMQGLTQPATMALGQASAASISGGAADTPPAAPLSPEELKLRDRRHFEAIERELAAEPVDAAWAPATERIISDTMARPIFAGSKLLGSTCHSTLCRFEVSHASERDRRRFGSALPNRLPSLPSGSMRQGEGSEPRTIVYVAREGHQIPRDELE